MKVFWLFANIVQALFTAFWTAFWISLALVALVCTLNPDVPLAMARRFWGPGLLWGSRAKLKIEPLPDVDWTQPHIFVMNHQSMIDIVTAFVAIPVNIRFVAKQVLKYVPFLGWYMWATGMIFVDRGNRERALRSLEEAGARIRSGSNILAYPEGTRSRDGRIMPFKKGPFAVALKAGVPIIPVALEGAGRVLPSDGFGVRPGTIRVKFGAPIPTAGIPDAGRDGLIRQVRNALIDLHLSIGGPGGDREGAIAQPGREGVGSAAPAADVDRTGT